MGEVQLQGHLVGPARCQQVARGRRALVGRAEPGARRSGLHAEGEPPLAVQEVGVEQVLLDLFGDRVGGLVEVVGVELAHRRMHGPDRVLGHDAPSPMGASRRRSRLPHYAHGAQGTGRRARVRRSPTEARTVGRCPGARGRGLMRRWAAAVGGVPRPRGRG